MKVISNKRSSSSEAPALKRLCSIRLPPLLPLVREFRGENSVYAKSVDFEPIVKLLHALDYTVEYRSSDPKTIYLSGWGKITILEGMIYLPKKKIVRGQEKIVHPPSFIRATISCTKKLGSTHFFKVEGQHVMERFLALLPEELVSAERTALKF